MNILLSTLASGADGWRCDAVELAALPAPGQLLCVSGERRLFRVREVVMFACRPGWTVDVDAQVWAVESEFITEHVERVAHGVSG